MTRVSQQKRTTRRIVSGLHGDYVVELLPEGLRMRPLRSRQPHLAVEVKWEAIYQRALLSATRRGQR